MAINANPNNLETLQGVIVKTFSSMSTFTAGVISVGNEEIKFSAKMGLSENDAVILYGKWVEHKKYGRQFEASTFQFDTKPNAEGLTLYLSNNPAFYGIGKVRAKKIATAFADNFEEVLFNEPAKIQQLGGIPETAIITLQQEWRKNQAHNLASTELAGYGLSYAKAKKLLEDHKIDIVAKIKKNPYILIDLVAGYGFKTVDAIALKMGFPFDGSERLQAGFCYMIEQNENKGNCWIEQAELLETLKKELSLYNVANKEIFQDNLQVLIDENRIILDIIVSNNSKSVSVASRRLYEQEQYIINLFNTEVRKLDSDYLLAFLKESEAYKPDNLRLNHKQFLACCNSLSYNISGFVGAAGTGKTHSISSIIQTLLTNPTRRHSIALAAPTGKAAKRMEELTGRESKTIHRLLEYSQAFGKFMKNEENKLSVDVVIIDETSMVDIPLFYNLLKAIDFSKTRLILVGDDNQLPPVGIGNILRDLISTQAIPLVVLDEVMRNAGALKHNSLSILKGQLSPTTEEETEKRKGLKRWYLLNNKELDQQVIFAIQQSFTQSFDKYGFDLLMDVQVLTPTHKGSLGTKALNIFLQALLQNKLYNVVVEPVLEGHKPTIYIGDKIIQTRNNYDYDIMNGSMGIVKAICKKKEITFGIEQQLEDWNTDKLIEFKDDDYIMLVDFGSKLKPRLIALPKTLEILNDIELAYVVTCHKAQGSEFPCVIVIAHSMHSFMLHRNWFYTAVTRARECCIILGDNKGSYIATVKEEKDRRLTYSQFYLTPFTDRQTPEPSPDAPNGAGGTRNREPLYLNSASVEIETLQDETLIIEGESKESIEFFLEQKRLEDNQKPCMGWCSNTLSTNHFSDNGTIMHLCDLCYQSYLRAHNLDTTISSTTPIPTLTPTDNTITSPIVDTIAIPTNVTTEKIEDGRENEKISITQESSAITLTNGQMENQESTNSVLAENHNILVEAKTMISVKSTNLPQKPRKIITEERTYNLFNDLLADKYPFMHTEVIEREVEIEEMTDL